jgi:S-formylglutathione hydrolase FrmB
VRLTIGFLLVLLMAGCASPGVSPTPAASESGPSAFSPTPTSASASELPTIGLPADDGARIIGVDSQPPLIRCDLSGCSDPVSDPSTRARDLTIDSPSVGIVTVRLLVPRRFDSEPATRWPVLYLLHGGGGMTPTAWTEAFDVDALTAPSDLLVVMPEAGVGWYSDWWNRGAGGPPMWETFHLVELPQLLERNWHAGDKRAVAGLSMGGYGAMEYASRHPRMFVFAASYSGLLDPLHGTGIPQFLVGNLWGDPVKNADVWLAHDPTANAEGLRGTGLFVAYGNGVPGPLDDGHASPFDPTGEGERNAGVQGASFVARLAELGIPVTVDAYGNGTHWTPHWERDLEQSLPLLLEALGLEGA